MSHIQETQQFAYAPCDLFITKTTCTYFELGGTHSPAPKHVIIRIRLYLHKKYKSKIILCGHMGPKIHSEHAQSLKNLTPVSASKF